MGVLIKAYTIGAPVSPIVMFNLKTTTREDSFLIIILKNISKHKLLTRDICPISLIYRFNYAPIKTV